jgi:HSP20 family molecular chaperone IbpA
MAEQKENKVTKAAESRVDSNLENSLVPPVDIFEDTDSVTLFADLPGVTKDNLELQIDKDTLQIYARPARAANPNATAHYTEFPEKDYYRAFTIGEEIDRDKIKASMTGGVLKLVLAKSEKIKPKKINIKFS